MKKQRFCKAEKRRKRGLILGFLNISLQDGNPSQDVDTAKAHASPYEMREQAAVLSCDFDSVKNLPFVKISRKLVAQRIQS